MDHIDLAQDLRQQLRAAIEDARVSDDLLRQLIGVEAELGAWLTHTRAPDTMISRATAALYDVDREAQS